MGWADDLSNSMGMNVTPVYTGTPTATYGGGARGYTPEDANTVSAAIARQRELVDRDYNLRKREAKRKYEIDLMNAKTQRDVMKANREYNEAQAQIARDRLQFDRDSFAQTHALNQAKLGYDVLNMAANMRGAENYFQASNFARGVANDPNSSTFLSALKNNARMPDFTAQFAAPDANTFGALTAKLGTPLVAAIPNAAAPAGADNAYLGQIHALAAAGGHKLGAGALEQLSGDELKLLRSGMEAPMRSADGRETAYNFNDFLDQYRRSRIGQSTGSGYQAA
jgi:hypothetical protein